MYAKWSYVHLICMLVYTYTHKYIFVEAKKINKYMFQTESTVTALDVSFITVVRNVKFCEMTYIQLLISARWVFLGTR